MLPADLVGKLKRGISSQTELGAQDLVVVIAHDCDVNARSFDAEPNVELAVARKVEKEDGSKRMGKSSRYLQLKLDDGWYELWAADKFTVNREFLNGFEPSCFLPAEETKYLSEWLARRYSRAAFPSAFDRRIEPIKNKIKKCLEGVAQDIFGIYFQVSQGEIGSDEDYSILGYAVMLDRDFRDTKKHELATTAFTTLQSLLETVKIKLLEDVEIVSDKSFSLKSIRLTKRWDWDVLSYDEGASGHVES